MPVFQAAYKELCTRIWIELELLAQLESRPPQDLDMRMAILRLEIVVLLDSCRSPSWRGMLSAAQRDSLGSMLTDVLAALYVDSEQIRAGIEAAQDRVLCELLPESGAALAAEDADREPLPAETVLEPWQESRPELAELVRAMEAHAVARAAP